MINSLKFSLMLAKINRLCPPAHIKEMPEHAGELQKHISVCPYCSTGLSPQSSQWAEITKSLTQLLPRALTNTGIKQAEIRPVKEQRALWRDHFFYSPPLVVVRDVDPDAANLIRVAQVYEDILLAAPGDLIVEDESTPGPESFFIECWNWYSVHADCLGPPVSRISEELLTAVRKMADNPSALPQNTPHPLPMLENDPRHYFRKLEIAVGYTFAAPAAQPLMAETESQNTARHKPLQELSRFMAELRRIQPAIFWDHTPQNVPEAILTARFPADQLPMAADEKGGNILVIKRVAARNNRLELFEPLYAEVILESKIRRGIAISGRLTSRPPENAYMSAAWMTDRGRLIFPTRIEYEAETGMFYIELDVEQNLAGELVIALVTEDSPYDQQSF